LSAEQSSVDYLENLKVYIRKEQRERESFFEMVERIMTSMLDENNTAPCIEAAIKAAKGKRHYKNKNWNIAVLEELDVIDPSTYTRLQDYDYVTRLSTVVSICLVLCLDLTQTEELANAAGFSLKKKSKLNLAYSFIIDKNFEESKRRDNEYCFERITTSDWLKVYNAPTVEGGGRTVIKHTASKNYDWAMYEGLTGINPYAKGEIEKNGGKVTVVSGSRGELTDETGRYWVAVGPNVMTPTHTSDKKITLETMKYGTKMDILVEGNDGNRYYIPAVVGDVKAHTSPGGLYQTGLGFPGEKDYPLHNDGSTVEFMGKTRAGTDQYLLIGIIVYDHTQPGYDSSSGSN